VKSLKGHKLGAGGGQAVTLGFVAHSIKGGFRTRTRFRRNGGRVTKVGGENWTVFLT